MSVIIRDMDIPENCSECRFSNIHCCGAPVRCLAVETDAYKGISNNLEREYIGAEPLYKLKRHSICPLVKIPENHGKLIDIDKLNDLMYHEAFEMDSDRQKWDSGCWIRYKMYEEHRDNTPTIFEAEHNDGDRQSKRTI